ncbi:hypothetical protein ACH4ZX_09340 [Streptomyces sp. NPDC020490]|uniref:hypothetical protein n=1 Tax=Streptomyces sp. NPDC020490 TaxID=3365078 RepID=UPI00379FB100
MNIQATRPVSSSAEETRERAAAPDTRGTAIRGMRNSVVVALATAALGAGLAVGTPASAAPVPARAATVSTASTTTPATPAALSVTGTSAGVSAGTSADRESMTSARWFNLYHAKKNRKHWVTAPVVSRAKVLQVAWRCWNGGDGTKGRVSIQRYRFGFWYTVSTSRKWLCLGGTIHTRINNAAVHGIYRASIQLSGKSHTTEVWLQNYG